MAVLYVLWAGALLIWPAFYAGLLIFAALARTADALVLAAIGMFLLLAVGLMTLPASNEGKLLAFLLAVVVLLLSALIFGVKLLLLRRKVKRRTA